MYFFGYKICLCKYTCNFSKHTDIIRVYKLGQEVAHMALLEWSYVVSKFSYCPCFSRSKKAIPIFVGNDYYCESGNIHVSPLIL